jgi:hypothetical protein
LKNGKGDKKMIEIKGGYHNAGWLSVDWQIGEELSEWQYRRIKKHLCPWGDCMCLSSGAVIKINPEGDSEEFLKELGEARIKYGVK